MAPEGSESTGLPGAPSFAQALIEWQGRAGRQHLPWQQTRDPYAIWVSEIMLQQTQVQTVLGYYDRFMQRFPQISDLAEADLETVLALWSGLGYYRRAQLMHACAKVVMAEHAGMMPSDPARLAALPGIGRSTAAAIVAFAWGQRAAILDGNVKRVLCRVFGIEGWPGQRAVEQALWRRAEQVLPAPDSDGMRPYTQGLMDLGALVCTRSRPQCERCPVADRCIARAESRQAALPAARPPRRLQVRHAVLALVCEPDATVWLERRPARGIWGGLWSLPELRAPEAEPIDFGVVRQRQQTCLLNWQRESVRQAEHGAFRHTFTHFVLQAQIQRIDLAAGGPLPATFRRLAPDALATAALPRPIRTVLEGWWGVTGARAKAN